MKRKQIIGQRKWTGGAICAVLVGSMAFASTGSAFGAEAESTLPTSGLIVDYDFSQTTGIEIANRVDGSDFGPAEVKNSSDELWRNGVLNLPGGNKDTTPWVQLPEDLLKDKDSATVQMEVKLTEETLNSWHFLWNIGGPNNTQYLFASLSRNAVPKVVVRESSAGNEFVTEAQSNPALADQWMSVTAVIDGSGEKVKISLYVDGKLIAENVGDYSPADVTDQSLNTIGHSPWPDPNIGGAVSTFRIWDRAITAEEVASIADLDAIALKDQIEASTLEMLGSLGIADGQEVEGDLSLPTRSGAITWASSAPEVISTQGTVTRPAYGESAVDVTLTATTTVRGIEVSRAFAVVVLPEATSIADRLEADAQALQIHNAEQIKNDFGIPTLGASGSTISWEITGGTDVLALSEGVNANSKTVKVARPAAGTEAADASLKATLSLGDQSIVKELPVTVAPMPGVTEETEAYVWAFFTGEGDGAEKVSLAASKGNDALAWNTLNDGQPIFESTEGTEGLRDPFIIRSHDGDKFYLLATDLKIAGLPGGFTTAQREGSKYIEIWESDDLVTWSNQRHVKVSSDYAGNTWAPEAYWDADRGLYVVYWASNLYDTADPSDRSALTYNRMMYATTPDFVTFSQPEVWVDVDRRGQAGAGTIDVSVADLDGVYYRFIKDEGNMTLRQEKSTDLLATVTDSLPEANGPADQWTLVKSEVAAGQPNGVEGGTFRQGEGPNIFQGNAGDVNGYKWYLFIDQPDYHGGPNHYVPFASNDLTDGESWVSVANKLRDNLPQNADGGKPRHGTVIPVTRAEYQKVLEEYQPDIAVKTVDAIEVQTSIGVHPRMPKAHMVMADGSTADVDVTWEDIADDKLATAGSFTLNGVAQDASRMPVEARITVTDEPTADLESLTIAGREVDLDVEPLTAVVDSIIGLQPSDIQAVPRNVGMRTEIEISEDTVTVTVSSEDATVTRVYEVRLIAPTAAYTMTHSDGKLVDVSGNGADAPLTGLADDAFSSYGDANVLEFANNGYASIPSGPITSADNDFTVEMTVNAYSSANHFAWVIGDGVGAWNTTALGNHVFVNPNSAQSGYAEKVLAGIRVKSGDNNGETRVPEGGPMNPGFSTVTLVSKGQTLTVYVDGEKISDVTHDKSLRDIIPSGDILGYLGRSLYKDDALFTGMVSDMKIWDQALTAAQVKQTMPTGEQKADLSWAVIEDSLETTMLGSNESADAVTENLAFPSSIRGVALTWTPSDSEAVTAEGKILPVVGDRNVTVTVSDNAGHSKEISIVVKGESEELVRTRIQADLDAIVLKDRTTENLPLVAIGPKNSSRITWNSADPSLISGTDTEYQAPTVGAADPYQGAGIVTRPSYGSGDAETTVTATATLSGIEISRDYAVVVAEQGRTAPDAGYAAAYFKSDGPGGEKIWMDATTENDFFTFKPVNEGEPVIDLQVDTKGLRDPYILRSHDGDKYYMIATDLCIGCGTSWGDAQSKGSLKVHVWESVDMVHWDRTNGEDSGIVVNQPEAGMTWAPEAYWDDDLQAYVVFFASRLYGDESHTDTPGGGHARMFYVITRDFQSFTYPPVEWQNTGFARIDSSVAKIGDYYYRFTKNEDGGAADGLERGKDIFLEKSASLTAPTTRSDWNADPQETWQLIDTAMTAPKTRNNGEGPEIVKLNEDDPNNTDDDDGYVFLVDNYSAGGYVPFLTTGTEITSSNKDDRLSLRDSWNPGPKDGLPASPRHGAFVNVPHNVLDAMHTWGERPAVGSTLTVEDVADRTAIIRVTADDLGDVAGTVTFVAGEWKETVALNVGSGDMGATAAVTVPGNVGGTVFITYNPHVDKLVKASSGQFDIQVAPEPVQVNKDQLGKVIALAESLDSTGYTDASWDVLTKELKAAKNVLNDPQASQILVDEATANLQKAIDSLEKIAPTDPGSSEPTKPDNAPDQGLAITGATIGWLIAVALVAAGLGAALLIRRRRTR
ncbi:family 43 glycosylhydrolase [Actinomycetaceae bacterium WB03_NA08]|uniref:Family 43 glycosylhydrolase n=1 Tax=Scrofimicrobium canadense TaxID=2652290 RepID=A0A6N7W785_9ACTO|nr:immunoglobulin-like domain-containing protein [Scrofimicrobium canadense]MSS84363.1 family 43 glycosylhydrolase [Scrofimicrobium canadense]